MYQVLIADDEPSVIESLEESLDWGALGLELAGSVGSGREAWEFCHREKVDIVILDIRMPGLNGLELCEKLRKESEEIQLIIISGYAEFSYAERAMRYGVLGYCLKPLEYDKLTRLLLRAVKNLEKAAPADFDGSFLDALENGDTELVKKILESRGMREELFFTAVTAGEERLELSPEEGILLDLGQGQCGYITQQAISEERLRKYLSRPGNQGAGIGEKSVRAEELSQEIQTCIAKAYQFFVTPQNRLCRRLEEKKAAALLEKVQKSVWEDRWEQVCDQLGEMERGGMDFFTVRSAVKLCNIIFTGSLFREEETDYYIYGIRQLVTEYGNLKTMLESLRAAILAARTEGAEENYTNAAFMKLMVYIRENYKKEISLSTAGEALHMNPNYVSQLFKKEAGITFIHYITQLRMEEAVNLLSMTKKPVVEIASEVGYNDYFYFCKTFKKYMGKTPSRYREEC